MELTVQHLEREPPFDPDALAFELDRDLVLRMDRPVQAVAEDFETLTRDAESARRLPLGQVVVGGRDPYRLLAVVHDLDREPSWSEQWVASAYRSLVQACEERDITSLATPLLGTVYGRMDAGTSLHWLLDALQQAPAPLEQVWLQADPSALPQEARRQLRELQA